MIIFYLNIWYFLFDLSLCLYSLVNFLYRIIVKDRNFFVLILFDYFFRFFYLCFGLSQDLIQNQDWVCWKHYDLNKTISVVSLYLIFIYCILYHYFIICVYYYWYLLPFIFGLRYVDILSQGWQKLLILIQFLNLGYYCQNNGQDFGDRCCQYC